MNDLEAISSDSMAKVVGGAGKGDLLKMGWAWLSRSRAPVRGPANGVHLNEGTGAVTTYNDRGLRARQYEYGHNDPYHPPGSTGNGMHNHTFGPDGSRGPAVPTE